MDATTTTPTELITCDGCGTQVPSADSYYVDGAGQLCTNCTAPMPETLVGIEPALLSRAALAVGACAPLPSWP